MGAPSSCAFFAYVSGEQGLLEVPPDRPLGAPITAVIGENGQVGRPVSVSGWESGGRRPQRGGRQVHPGQPHMGERSRMVALGSDLLNPDVSAATSAQTGLLPREQRTAAGG